MLGTEMAEGVPDERFVPRNGQCLSIRQNFNEEGGGVGNGGQMRRSQELGLADVPTSTNGQFLHINLCCDFKNMVKQRKNRLYKIHTSASLGMLDMNVKQSELVGFLVGTSPTQCCVYPH